MILRSLMRMRMMCKQHWILANLGVSKQQKWGGCDENGAVLQNRMETFAFRRHLLSPTKSGSDLFRRGPLSESRRLDITSFTQRLAMRAFEHSASLWQMVASSEFFWFMKQSSYCFSRSIADHQVHFGHPTDRTYPHRSSILITYMTSCLLRQQHLVD